MKTVLFVPGHTEDLSSRNYKIVLKAIESRGYKVVFVPINWRYSNLDRWVAELGSIYKDYEPSNTILAGFSFGAVTALMVAAKRNPAELWLFSLSAYFKEDLPLIKVSWKKSIGPRKISSLEKVKFADVAPKIKCRTLVFMGSNEANKYPASKRRVEEAKRLLTDSQLIYVDGVAHDVSHIKYIKAIKAAI